MRRTLMILLLLIFVFNTPLFADPLQGYEPYEEEEFPIWSYKLRRAETLFFGSLVITLPVAAILYNLAQEANILTIPDTELQGLFIQGSIAAGLSVGISLADFIIGEVGE